MAEIVARYPPPPKPKKRYSVEYLSGGNWYFKQSFRTLFFAKRLAKKHVYDKGYGSSSRVIDSNG